MSKPAAHALLIGIDAYEPDEFPGGGTIDPLAGCVNDVARVQAVLQDKLQLADDNIVRLTSPRTARQEIGDPMPSYRNLVKAFEDLLARASPGDLVWIHYSGHGAQVPTAYPLLKGGPTKLDEALVPCDGAEGGFVRDVWLGRLLQRLAESGLSVTLVLDSCHSGGGTRKFETVKSASNRGLGKLTVEPGQHEIELAHPLDQPAKPGPTVRHVKGMQKWLPTASGYVFLAACARDQCAYEVTCPDALTGGALTRWLVEALANSGPLTTCQQVYEWVLTKVRDKQTPLIEGESYRPVFATERDRLRSGEGRSSSGVTVLSIGDSGRLLLNTGQAQGIRSGTRFAVFASDELDVTRPERRKAVVEVVEQGATESWAELVGADSGNSVCEGDQALPIDLGPMRLSRSVRLVGNETDSSEALDRVRRELAERAQFIELVESEDAQLQVRVNRHREYQVFGADTSALPHHLRPAIGVDEPGAASRLVARLDHLARYRNILELANHCHSSGLRGRLRAELFPLSDDFDQADRPQPVGRPLDAATVKVGHWLCLRVTNQSDRTLRVVVLGIQSDWSIEQIFPTSSQTDFFTLKSGDDEVVALRACLPDGFDEGIDVLKVVATVGPASFRWLELPPLDYPAPKRGTTRSSPEGSLDQLFAALASDSMTRSLRPPVAASNEWTTTQLEVHVMRGD